MNFQKSKVAFSPNTPNGVREEITRDMGMETVSCYEKYLGFPAVMTKNNKNVFDIIKERAAKKVGGWRERYFSVGGKELLLKSVAQAVPTYTMGLFKLPKGMVHDLNRIVANFWWGSSERGRKVHWRKWKTLCKHK